jgi:purine-binding chemotaxis protein CheW
MTRQDSRRTSGLVEHDVALDTLLSSLLAEVPDYVPNPPPASAVPQGLAARPDAMPGAVLNPAPPAPITQPELNVQQPPEWAGASFRVLLFRIGAMQFAVPLAMLRAVSELAEPPHQVPGQPAWHLGLVRYRGESLMVADLGALLGIRAVCDDPQYLLVIGDVAIACDALGEALTAEPAAVRWRRGGEARAWLAGLLTGPMCALLDVAEIDRLIRHG